MNGYISPHRKEWHLRKRIGCKCFLFETQDIIRNLWLSKKGYVCVCMCVQASMNCVHDSVFFFSSPAHFSSSLYQVAPKYFVLEIKFT